MPSVFYSLRKLMKKFFCVGLACYNKEPIVIFSCKEGNYSEKFSCLTKLQK